MFENIKPSEPIHTVALPGEIARTLDDVYFYNDIKDTGIIIKGNHGGYRCLHEPQIYETYGPIQKQWYTEFKRKYPDFKLPTIANTSLAHHFDDSVLSRCFETNLSDKDIWTLVDRIINNSDTDTQMLITKEKLKESEIRNAKFIQENL